jgi:hypothetical protein
MMFSPRLAALAGAAILFVSSPLPAQEGVQVDIDPNVFNMFLESMSRQPASQATAEQREQARDQLVDLYLLSDLPRAQELKAEPRTADQGHAGAGSSHRLSRQEPGDG